MLCNGGSVNCVELFSDVSASEKLEAVSAVFVKIKRMDKALMGEYLSVFNSDNLIAQNIIIPFRGIVLYGNADKAHCFTADESLRLKVYISFGVLYYKGVRFFGVSQVGYVKNRNLYRIELSVFIITVVAYTYHIALTYGVKVSRVAGKLDFA